VLALDWWAGLTSLGWMLVAASPRGICWIDFATDPAAAARALRAAFPKAALHPDEARLASWFDRVRDLILLPAEARDLPLDIQGTAFQCRVWKALRRIPLGATISYGELARRIGAPRAVRAVAQACGSNPLPVVIPCHRVIGADGTLTGYTGGLDRKEALLAREGATGWRRGT
jgi:AraC family transcriptional regulator of adaptative response/methylated-DNA-[protein]-cysteine methyltransferase